MDWVVKDWEKGRKIPYSKIYENNGLQDVVGIAINGHYAIAGPIYIAAVMFNGPYKRATINAKHLSHQACDKLAQEYRANPKILWDLALVPPGHIIYSSIKDAVVFGIITVLSRFDYVNKYNLIISEPFTWGSFIPYKFRDTLVLTSKQAADQSDLVAVASVLARSAREHYMTYLGKQFPEFGWETNSGHATAQHIEAIKQYGVCVEHRGLDQVKSLKGTLFKVYRGNNGG